MFLSSAASAQLSRRNLLGLGLGAAGALGLTACSRATGGGTAGASGGGGGSTVAFWDTVWGADSYVNRAQELVQSYSADGMTGAYQSVPWASYYQTFSSAVASNTAPAASSGGGYQAFQFYAQDAINPADNVIKALQDGGAEFGPGLLESMQYDGVYVGVPWQVDIRVLWYRQSLLEQVGAAVPTDWDTLRDAGLKLKAAGIQGFSVGAGTSTQGTQAFLAMLINNGGGWFDADGNVDCITDNNIQAVEYLLSLAKDGIITPAAVSYSQDNITSDWTTGKTAIGFDSPTLAQNFGADQQEDILVASPITGPTGKTGTMRFVNNLMMYKTVDTEVSEAFLTWYLQNMSVYWTEGLLSSIPALQSIVDTPEYQADARAKKIAEEWNPIGGTYASLASSANPAMAAVDGGQPTAVWAQQIVQQSADARTILETLQTGLEGIVTS